MNVQHLQLGVFLTRFSLFLRPPQILSTLLDLMVYREEDVAVLMTENDDATVEDRPEVHWTFCLTLVSDRHGFAQKVSYAPSSSSPGRPPGQP